MPSNGLTSLLWFIAIVAAIPVALWLLKRTPMGGGGGAAATGVLKSIAAMPLSASQRIVTVEVGSGASRRWLVLGVTAQTITTLHTMEPGLDGAVPTDTVPAVPPFAQMLLARLRSGANGARNEHPTDGR
jgi:flagellar protein FliO/FliZ